MKANCQTCRYWDWESANLDGEAGHCKRFPPQLIPEVGPYGQWPLTYSSEVCGEHKPPSIEGSAANPPDPDGGWNLSLVKIGNDGSHDREVVYRFNSEGGDFSQNRSDNDNRGNQGASGSFLWPDGASHPGGTEDADTEDR